MERINLIYIGLAIGVIAFVFLLMVPPIIRMLETLNIDVTIRWLILTILIPIITLLLLYIALTQARKLYSDKEKEQIKELIEPELTEKEIFEETLFDNEKMRVLNLIHIYTKVKGYKIPLSAIEKKTGFDLDKIEDIIVILMADELLDGKIEYPDEGPMLILPERKEIKVRYIKNSNDNEPKNRKKTEKKKEG